MKFKREKILEKSTKANMENTVQLEVSLLLPEVEDERDQCVERLLERVSRHRGIDRAHVDRKNDRVYFCLHYDPNLVTLRQVRRWAEQAGAEVAGRYGHETMTIRNMDCGDCAASIEHIFGRMEGVLSVSVNYAAEKMRIEYDSRRLRHKDIVKRLATLGYAVEEATRGGWLRQNRELALSLLSGAFLAGAFFGETWFGLAWPYAAILYGLAYLAGGYDIARHSLKALLLLRFDIDVLMLVAAIGAAFVGEWPEGAFLLFLFSLGHALEHYATGKARRAIRALAEITPKTARVRRDGREQEIPVEKLKRGDLVVVRNGERIPVDGVVKEGFSAVDQSPITGESIPVEKQAGDEVFAGSVNGDGALEIEVTRLAKDTTLARVIQMVEEAQTQKSPTQRFTEKFESWFVPSVLLAVLVAMILPPLVGWLSWKTAFLRAMAMLVAASPCALAVGTPAAVLSGIARAARNGVLIKGGLHLENLGALQAMAFDKTGTITRGEPAVTDLVPLNETDADALLRLAAAVESRSQHPLAQAIVREAEARRLQLPEADDMQALTGRGVQARVAGETVYIGNLRLFSELDGAVPDAIVARVQELEGAGKTTMIVRKGAQFVGIIGLADQPRKEARATLTRLKQIGIRELIMITGDNERVAAAIAEQVGLTDYRANLLPQDKVAAIKEIQEDGRPVAMVGDGVNDAPAMKHATVGIAMGAGGTDVALETADVALMADDLSRLPFAVALSRQARRIIWQNLVVSLGVIALLLPSALLGLAGMGVAVTFHEGSTLVVVGNALRLLRFESRETSSSPDA